MWSGATKKPCAKFTNTRTRQPATTDLNRISFLPSGPPPIVRRTTCPESEPNPLGKPLNAVVCSRVRELQEALSAGTIALEISSRNSRVSALQNRWDRLRAGLDLVLDQRGANMDVLVE